MVSRHLSVHCQWYIIETDGTLELPSQHEPVEVWLRRASHAGRTQGRNLSSAFMAVDILDISYGTFRIDLLDGCRALLDGATDEYMSEVTMWLEWGILNT